MIVAAAVCPWPPVLVRDLTGRDPVVPGLRRAAEQAVRRVVQSEPQVIVVVGAAQVTREWPPGCRLNLSVFAPTLQSACDPALPPSLGVGATLLDLAGYSGRRILQAVAEDEPVAGCASLGQTISRTASRVGLLAMGDGSARRGPKAPGYFDERAVAFDAGTEQALRRGELDALLAISPGMATELMATGRPAWQVLAGAMSPATPVTDVLYADDPFGVAYLVAYLQPSPAGAT